MTVAVAPDHQLLGNAAVDYARNGLEVFPVNAATKAPLVSQHQANTHKETVEGWWRQWPGALIGHRVAPDVLILDVDTRHGGLATWSALKTANGPVPVTRTHFSGRGDKGGHLWFKRPPGKLSEAPLHQWAKEHGTGQAVGKQSWVSGVDLLRYEHRYSILPPSPHPDTHRPYFWAEGRGLEVEPAEMPEWLAALVTARPRLTLADARPLPRHETDSIADWVSENWGWADLLTPEGWTLVQGDGDSDGSAWRHPNATSAQSATVKHGCLFVYTPNTDFEVTATGDVHGYTRFRAYATLAHGGDQSAAAREARRMKGDGGNMDLPATLTDCVGTDPTPGPGPLRQQESAEILFRRFTMPELLAEPRTFKWLVRGMLTEGTYGMTAGELKTLKTYFTICVALGVASGESIFGHFAVDEPRPVLLYVGEGGRIPYTRRLERVAASMKLDLGDLPIHASFETAAVQSTKFQTTLSRDLDEVRPGLVIVDPLYSFHGSGADARNLHEEGALLNMLSGPCVEAGACLDLVNHFNQTGTTTGLKRITMAGGGEWVDSWRLLSHRSDPDVANGRFHLLLEIGSRQWGGSAWELDLDVGCFDQELEEFDGPITWDLQRRTGSKADETAQRMLAVVAEHPFEFTREELVKRVGGRAVDMRRTVDRLEQTGKIEVSKVARSRSDGRPLYVWVFGPPSDGGTERTAEAEF